MKAIPLTAALVALCGAASLAATEIATGPMLGPRYKADRFYVRANARAKWEETYSQSGYRGQTRGALLLVDASHGLFHDEWLSEVEFDPEANTDALVAGLDVYKLHGALGVWVSLQGLDSPYSEASGVARTGRFLDGPQRGSRVSAFAADGSLDPAWMGRLERLLDGADRRGMVVALTYFTPGQDDALDSDEAIVKAARNATNWLIEKGFRNVLVNVADSWDEPGVWDHGDFVTRNVANLVFDVRDQFNHAEFTLPIGAASAGARAYPNSLARVCDLILARGSAVDAGRAAAQLGDHSRPIVLVENPAEGALGAAALDAAARSLGTLLQAPGGWVVGASGLGLRFPFAYQPGEKADPGAGSAGYLRAMLEKAAAILLRKPPQGRSSDED